MTTRGRRDMSIVNPLSPILISGVQLSESGIYVTVCPPAHLRQIIVYANLHQRRRTRWREERFTARCNEGIISGVAFFLCSRTHRKRRRRQDLYAPLAHLGEAWSSGNAFLAFPPPRQRRMQASSPRRSQQRCTDINSSPLSASLLHHPRFPNQRGTSSQLRPV